MRNFADRAAKHPAAIDLALAALVAALTASIYFSHYGASMALSADNAFPYVLFDDLIRRRLPLHGVMWPESPFFFPDAPLAFFVRLVTPGVRTAVMLYAVTQAILIFMALRWLLVNVLVDLQRARVVWSIWLLIFLLMSTTGCVTYATWLGQFGSYVFVPNNHAGCLLATLAGFALLMPADGKGSIARLAALALLCGLTALSDRLFEVQFMLPGILVGLFAFLARRSKWHLIASTVLAASVAAFEAMRHYFPSNLMRWFAQAAKDSGKTVSLFGGDPNSHVNASVAAQRTLSDLGALIAGDPYVTLLMAAGTLALAYVLAVPMRAGTPGQPRAGEKYLALIALLSALAPLSAGVLLGRHIDTSTFRYCMTVMLLPLGLAIIATRASFQHGGPGTAKAAYGVLVAAIIFVAASADTGRAALANYNRDQENCFVAAAKTHRLKFGVGDYWQGVSMLARQPTAPIIAPIAGDAGPRITMMANLAWFGATAARAAELPTLDFVDEYGFKPALLDAAYGPGRERISCPASTLRIYDDADGILSRMYRHFEWLPSLILTRIGSVTLPAAAWPAEDRFVEGDTLHAAGRFASGTAILQTFQEFPPGQIRNAWIEYSLENAGPGNRATWAILPLDDRGRPIGTMGDGVLEPTADPRQAKLAVGKRPDRTNGLGIAIQVEGNVDLKLLAFHIEIDDRPGP